MTFKRLVLMPLAALVLAVSAPAKAAEYKIDHSHTFIEFKVIHLGFSGTLTGDFTLMGVTKPIEIKVKKIGEGKDPWGGYRAGFEGTAEFDRRDFGMGYDLGPKSNTVSLDLYLEGIRQ